MESRAFDTRVADNQHRIPTKFIPQDSCQLGMVSLRSYLSAPSPLAEDYVLVEEAKYVNGYSSLNNIIFERMW